MYNYGSIWLNDIPMPDFLIVTGCSHDITGSIEHDTADIPGSNGVIIRSTKKNPRSITFDFKYRDSGFLTYENKEEISSWIHSNNLKSCKLELSWIPGSYYLVVPTGDTGLDDKPKIKSFSLEFLLVNPCRIETEEELKTGSFKYIGTESTYPILTFSVKEACNKIKLEFSNDLDNGFIELNASFNVGNNITIDCKKKSIKVNGIDKMPILSIDSDFPKIETGWNYYNLTAGNVSFNISYNNMYR